MTATIEIPTESTAREAQAALRALSPLLPARKATSRTVVVRPDGPGAPPSVRVPVEAFELFLEILGQMANGNAVTIVPVHAELTTQEAADILNVSRPFLIKLIEDGKLPVRLVGTHRRIKMADLMAYKEADLAERKAAVDELAAEAQKLGL
jgi:excisionase family DNA binding protein